MEKEFASGEWHLVINYAHASLRRYRGKDAAAAYANKEPFDAIASAEIDGNKAFLFGLLAKEPPLSRSDRRGIEKVLSEIGVVEVISDRGGKAPSFMPDKTKV